MDRTHTRHTNTPRRSPTDTPYEINLCTLCRHKGIACQAGFTLIENLQKVISRAGDSLAEDFEISGYAEMTGCDRPCVMAYFGSRTQTYLFGDVPPDADIDGLVQYTRTHHDQLNLGAPLDQETELPHTPASFMATSRATGQPH